MAEIVLPAMAVIALTCYACSLSAKWQGYWAFCIAASLVAAMLASHEWLSAEAATRLGAFILVLAASFEAAFQTFRSVGLRVRGEAWKGAAGTFAAGLVTCFFVWSGVETLITLMRKASGL